MDSNFWYRGTKAREFRNIRASRVALAPGRVILAAACAAVVINAFAITQRFAHRLVRCEQPSAGRASWATSGL